MAASAEQAGASQTGMAPLGTSPADATQIAARLLPHRRQWRDLAWLMRFDKPIGTLLLLWPTLWALWIASGGMPRWDLLLIFTAGTFCMRSAGCVANDLTDRNIDPYVRRTRERPLAARRISPYIAIALLLVLALCSLGLVLLLNRLSLILALIGAALTVSYPFTKRFLPVPQFYLGLAFAWGVPMAFAAASGSVPRTGWLLMLAGVLWAGVYDTFYAMADREDDRRIEVRSSAITFGDLDLVFIGVMQLLMLLALLFVGLALQRGLPFYLALGSSALLFGWQLWTARRRDVEGVTRAFRNNGWLGAVMLLGIAADYAWYGAAGLAGD